MTKPAALLLLIIPLLAACSTLDSRTEPKINLTRYHHVFVEHLLADGYGTDQLIARELRARGYDATSGPLTMLPDNAEIIVAYNDRWTFDFTDYMIELDVTVSTNRTEKRLASAHYRRPALFGGSTVEMVDTVLDKLFPATPAGHQ